MRAKWTCGECGQSWEFESVVADSQVSRERSAHLREHRVEKMDPEKRRELHRLEMEAMTRVWRAQDKIFNPPATPSRPDPTRSPGG